MDTSKLKKFAQFARRTLMGQVSAKLDSVLAPGAAARREHPEAMKKLEAAIARDGKGQVIERVAYIWFNRFSALALHGRERPQSRSRRLALVRPVPARNPGRGEGREHRRGPRPGKDSAPRSAPCWMAAARARTRRPRPIGCCSSPSATTGTGSMPFLFERIDDYTELLLPEDLLSNASILAYLREAMTPDVCEDVEVIGWLYQFYISEKKDEVFAGLKKNVKITAENIPAATQLVHSALDRALPGRELARAALDAQPAEFSAEGANGLLHRAGRAGDGLPAHLVTGGNQGLRSCLRFGAHADLCLRPPARDLRGGRI